MANFSTAATSAIPQNAPKPMTAIQEVAARLDVIENAFRDSLGRMQLIAARAFGASPPEPTKDVPRAVPNGEVGAVMERLQGLAEVAEAQGIIISRLDGIV